MSDSRLISLSSPIGADMLRESELADDFFVLLRWFETQATKGHCGVATAVMVLNALDIPKPPSPSHDDYCFYSQGSFFTDCVSRIKSESEVIESGLSIDEFAQAMSTFGVAVQAVLASTLTQNQFRDAILHGLATPGHFVVLNYARKVLGQEGVGHFSALAAYHKSTDSALILDVARYKCPSVWVPTGLLYEAAASPIKELDRCRGLILISSRD